MFKSFSIGHNPASMSSLDMCNVLMADLCCADAELLKDSNVLRLPSDRYSPVRRLSDGLTSVRKYRSQLEKIYKKALQNQVPCISVQLYTYMYWHDNVICLSVCLQRSVLWLNDTSYNKIEQMSEELNMKCHTILQLSTPYTDPIPSISPPPKFQIFTYLLHLAVLITWPFCLCCYKHGRV